MEDGLLIRMVIPRGEVTLHNVKMWIEEFVLFTPKTMRTKLTERKFKINQLYGEIEKLFSHNHFSKTGLWFGSSWRMWFGKQYFSIITREKILSFSDGYSNIELENDSICIILYKDVWDYENLIHRDIQWKFRKEVGIDEIAHSHH